MDPTVIKLRAILGKIDETLEMISIHEPLLEARSLVISWLQDLGELIED
jgi:hypothetical protein